MSKVIERTVASRFHTHISTSSLLPAQQSTYRSSHSTETAVLSVHNDLVRAADNGQVTLEPLQRVQNAAVRLIFQLGRREHVTPSLCQLHWLSIRWRIQFKLCTIMHSVHTGRCPAYLADCVQTVASSSSRSGLRSATSSRFVTPRLRTKFGERAFSYAGPAAWNSLPADIRATKPTQQLSGNF